MKNNKKKPSVFKNILIVMCCTLFAFMYAMIIVCFITGTDIYSAAFAVYSKPDVKVQSDIEILPEAEIQAETEFQPETEVQAETEFQSETEIQTETEFQSATEVLPAWAERVEIELDSSEAETETIKKKDSDVDETIEKKSRFEEKTESFKIGNVQTVQQADTAKAVVTDVTEVVKAAMPCVVAITNEYTAYDYWYGEEYNDKANGSGIIISQKDDELLILTNYHVVENANDLYVQFIDNMETMAYVKGVAQDEDLALVSVFLEDVSKETLEKIAIAALGDSDKLEVGEPSIAIGNSLGCGQSVTTGVISALNCSIFGDEDDISLTSLIQTDAAINPGNSGGALLNVNGEVIGINSSKIADYAIEGMGYAIPINTARPIVEELVRKETRKKVASNEKAFLGISGTDVSEEAISRYDMSEGVYVSDVLENTAAAKAGIKKGDIITAIDDEHVNSMTRLQGILDYYAAGTSADVTLMRISDNGYKKMTVTVTFGLKQD